MKYVNLKNGSDDKAILADLYLQLQAWTKLGNIISVFEQQTLVSQWQKWGGKGSH